MQFYTQLNYNRQCFKLKKCQIPYYKASIIQLKINFKNVKFFMLVLIQSSYFNVLPQQNLISPLRNYGSPCCLRWYRVCLQETCVQSPGWEDALKKGTANYSSIVAWKISWTEEPNGLQFIRSQRVGHN